MRDKAGTPRLIHVTMLEDVNSVTIAVTFKNALKVVWPDEIRRDKVLLYVSDGARYMVRSGNLLMQEFPKLLQVTCLAHGLQRISEIVRKEYPSVDQYVAESKKIFVKCPKRVRIFKETAPGIPLPPEPMLIRWRTWLMAVFYHCTHFSIVRNVIKKFPSSDAAAIKKCQKLLRAPNLLVKLNEIKKNYACIADAIAQLQEMKMSLLDAIQVVNTAVDHINNSDTVPFQIRSTLNKVLEKNVGYRILSGIAYGEEEYIEQVKNKGWTEDDIDAMEYAMITSCDVERSFSKYSTFMTTNRGNFMEDNIEAHMIVYCFE